MYGCTEAFLADVKWILHNCIIYNGGLCPCFDCNGFLLVINNWFVMITHCDLLYFRQS